MAFIAPSSHSSQKGCRNRAEGAFLGMECHSYINQGCMAKLPIQICCTTSFIPRAHCEKVLSDYKQAYSQRENQMVFTLANYVKTKRGAPDSK